MDATTWPELESDFFQWSGGFPPDSRHQITVYVDYACPFPEKQFDVTAYLIDWMMCTADET